VLAGGSAPNAYISSGGYEVWIVFEADIISSTGADVRQNHTLLASDADVFWMVLKDVAGVKTLFGGHFDGALKSVSDTVTTGAVIVSNLSYDGSRLRLEIDGNSDVTLAGVGSGGSFGTTVMTMGYTTYGGVFFDGAISDHG